MLTRWNTGFGDFDEMFSAMDRLRTQMDRAFEEALGARGSGFSPRALATGSWPRANLVDTGSALVVTAEVPGLSDKDVQITLDQDVLTVSGERKVEPPEGYAVHRRERAAVKFSRSFALPSRVDTEKAAATVRDGVLTVTLEKAADAKPRQIAVTSG